MYFRGNFLKSELCKQVGFSLSRSHILLYFGAWLQLIGNLGPAQSYRHVAHTCTWHDKLHNTHTTTLPHTGVLQTFSPWAVSLINKNTHTHGHYREDYIHYVGSLCDDLTVIHQGSYPSKFAVHPGLVMRTDWGTVDWLLVAPHYVVLMLKMLESLAVSHFVIPSHVLTVCICSWWT